MRSAASASRAISRIAASAARGYQRTSTSGSWAAGSNSIPLRRYALTAMSQRPRRRLRNMRFLLLPGAGGAARWYWRLVATRLQEGGHKAVPVDLPGYDPAIGLPEYV